MRKPGRGDLGQKASFATEGVQAYVESSANGGRIKNYHKMRKPKVFNLNFLKFVLNTREVLCFFHNTSRFLFGYT